MKIKKQITVCKTDTEIKIYPESKNELGLWIAHPPCFVVSINDVRNIDSMINTALQYSNSGVSVTEETAKNVLKEMRIKSWNILPQIRNCCDKMPVWLIPIILLSLAVMMVSYFS